MIFFNLYLHFIIPPVYSICGLPTAVYILKEI